MVTTSLPSSFQRIAQVRDLKHIGSIRCRPIDRMDGDAALLNRRTAGRTVISLAFGAVYKLGFQTPSVHLLSDCSSRRPDYSDSLPSPTATSRTYAILLWSPGASPILRARLPFIANVSDSVGLSSGHPTRGHPLHHLPAIFTSSSDHSHLPSFVVRTPPRPSGYSSSGGTSSITFLIRLPVSPRSLTLRQSSISWTRFRSLFVSFVSFASLTVVFGSSRSYLSFLVVFVSF